MCALFSFRNWFVLSLIWAGAMFYLAYTTWPHVPLDISPIDPATVEAMRGALLKHALFYGLLGAGVPALGLLIKQLFCARTPASS